MRRARGWLLALLAAALPVLLAELALRVHGSDNVRAAGVELRLFGGDQARVRELFELDPRVGFRPRLPSPIYDEHGTVRNDYPVDPPPGKQRVLFAGDSVVFRGRLVAAVRERLGDEHFEFWNGGVSGYNTYQELEYLREHTLGIRPARVLLVFHPNDFQSTPVSFVDAEGRMRVVTPAASRARISPLLFRHSHLYRWFLTRSLSRERDEARDEIRDSLAAMAELCRSRGIALCVLVLPHLEPRERWTDVIERRHAWILATLRELGIPALDLWPAIEELLASGVDVQETPGDHAHPGDEACRAFARAVDEAGLLEPGR